MGFKTAPISLKPNLDMDCPNSFSCVNRTRSKLLLRIKFTLLSPTEIEFQDHFFLSTHSMWGRKGLNSRSIIENSCIQPKKKRKETIHMYKRIRIVVKLPILCGYHISLHFFSWCPHTTFQLECFHGLFFFV